jgi:rhodanese-related sulfurtransferase
VSAVPEIDARTLAAKLAAKEPICLIDVREPEEDEICRLEGAVLIPMGELQAAGPTLEAPEGALVVVYCHHGVRSYSAARFLLRCGMKNVVSLAGGIDAWSREVDPGVARY